MGMTFDLNVYGSTIHFSRKTQFFDEVNCGEGINLQEEREKGNMPGYREVDPTKYDTFTSSDGAVVSNPINLYELQEGRTGYHSSNFGKAPAQKDPNIIDNSGMIGGTTEQIDPATLYWGYETETKSNSLHRYFFTDDLDFLYQAAEQYAKIESNQDYKYDPTESAEFIRPFLDFLNNGETIGKSPEAWERFQAEAVDNDSERISKINADGIVESTISKTGVQYIPTDDESVTEWEQLQSDFKAVARELAERMKNGESTDLESLESTITIKGAQFTMSEVKELQELCKAFESFSPEDGQQMYDYANLGLAKSMGSLIADKYSEKSEEFASALESAFHSTVDHYFEKIQESNTFNPNASYYVHKADVGASVTDMFASLDTSSREALEKSYQEQRAQFGEILNDYTSHMGHLSTSKGANLAQTDAGFQKMLDFIYS